MEREHYEVIDLDHADVLADFSTEVEAVASYELACQTDADWSRRVAVVRVETDQWGQQGVEFIRSPPV